MLYQTFILNFYSNCNGELVFDVYGQVCMNMTIAEDLVIELYESVHIKVEMASGSILLNPANSIVEITNSSAHGMYNLKTANI